MTLFISIAVALAAGIFVTRITKFFNMPDVTAYLAAGIIIGPFVLGRLGIEGLGFTTYEAVAQLDPLCDLALGFIAFALGTEFIFPRLKRIGKQAFIVGIFQAVLTSVIVMAALIGLHFIIPESLDLPTAIVMGAVAAATAPAATLLVIRQFKAKGPVTNILLPVVALDDAVGLIIFAICIGVAKGMMGGQVNLISVIVNPLIEIFGSLILGGIMGSLLTLVEKWFHAIKNRMMFIVSAVILTVALSMINIDLGDVKIGFSSLLVCMMMGTIFCNQCPVAEELMEHAERWTAPIYCLFFVLSGAALRLELFGDLTVVLIGVVYILFRSVGKYAGARASSKFAGCEPNIVKYLGITLLPQAGVALGMSQIASQQLGSVGDIIRNLTLFSVLIYELVGPSLTKMALTKAGEITPIPEEVRNRRERIIQESAEKRSARISK